MKWTCDLVIPVDRAISGWLSTSLAVMAVAVGANPAVAAGPGEIAVIFNASDPLSVATAEYYSARRGIPASHRIGVRFDGSHQELARETFEALRADVLARTPPQVQFYALAWTKPYRVDCMSITTAMALGFHPAYCASGCERTRLSPYYASSSRRPWDDFGMRPTMSIAARSIEGARALIDRGVAADGVHPRGTAYLVQTGDASRDVRAAGYASASRLVGDRIDVRIEKTPGLTGRTDVMFYFTGATKVPGVETNRFLPGAIADHLTSLGGVLTDSPQMSSLGWLEAGATGSYGTVVEPCNLPAKFPQPAIVMHRYLEGESLIEAYWKSVAMPGQGIFIGEPLARPFGPEVDR
jgi:uncharacterized protein (TIGR03790 family)